MHKNLSIRSLISLLGPFLALIVVYVIFGLNNHYFYSSANALLILNQTVIVAIAAIGMTMIIISGGIDLSVGSIIALAGTLAALLVTRGYSVPAVFFMIMVFAAFCGAINGALSVKLRLLPFIVTLGTMQVFRGLAKYLGNGATVNIPASITSWKHWMTISTSPHLTISTGMILMIALVILFTLAMKYTKLGRHIYAIGSNEQTARLCGIAVDRTKILVYTINGALVGIASLMNMAYSNQGDPTTAVGKELDIIAAVVIGGASLSGGVGTVLGAFIGALLMTTIRNGCTFNNVSSAWTDVISGSIIVAAVIVDRLRHRKSS